ncbi:hypothetical protein [Kitasatospora sp. MBT63]|uniref:hypothetical protein n=1 Tax=Kitasatospora sp. MBT63 TaxID=1444768 RepID=UPI0005395F69|nr:hypothetical protein [Kitasatospora sp. MBT63]
MRSGLVQLGAWTAATGAAVALSWFGVHAVLTDAVSDRPKAVPLPSPAAPPPVTVESIAPATSGSAPPSPSASTSTSTGAGAGSGTGGPADPSRAPSRRPSPSSSVHSYLVPGGRVALDIRADRAELVSATPDAGWQMQVWNGDHWMRIDFSHPEGTSSVFVTWNGHPPAVQTVPAP